MAQWPTQPKWQDPSVINSGNQYSPADGVAAADINLLIENVSALHDTSATKTEVAEKYTKPSTGIPESDLSSAVVEKLNSGSDIDIPTPSASDSEHILRVNMNGTGYELAAPEVAVDTHPYIDLGNFVASGTDYISTIDYDVLASLDTANTVVKVTLPSVGSLYGVLSKIGTDYVSSLSVVSNGTVTVYALEIDETSAAARVYVRSTSGTSDDNVVDLGTLTSSPGVSDVFTGTISDTDYAKLSGENVVVVATLSNSLGRIAGVVSSFLNGYRTSYSFFPSSASVVTFALTIESDKSVTAKMVEQKIIDPDIDITDPDNTDKWQSVKLDSADGKLYTEREVPRPSSANAGKVPVVSDDGAGYELEDKPEGIPTGGTTGQVLTKDSDGNATWQSQSGGIVPVSELPTANETEYNKHALYLYDGALNYIVSKTVVVPPSTPTAETLSETLPSARQYTSAAAVGTDCYVFGGRSSTGDLNQIVKFDTVSQTVTTLSATLPSATHGTSTAAVGTDCYVFGGRVNLNEIVKFDTISQTVTTLLATLPSGRYYTSAAAVGTDCYVFGGYDGYYGDNFNEIVKFDTISQTVTTLSATLPSGRSATSAAAVGTDCYVFGGTGNLNQIVKFDTVSQTVTTLSATLPSGRSATSAAAVGTDCYVFGGFGQGTIGYLNAIVKFNTITQTVTTLSATLPGARQNTSAAAVGTDCYVFGGFGQGTIGYLNAIVKFNTGAEHSSTEYSYKTLLNKGDTTYTETENSQGGTTISDAIVVKYENGKQTAVIA